MMPSLQNSAVTDAATWLATLAEEIEARIKRSANEITVANDLAAQVATAARVLSERLWTVRMQT